MAMCTIVYIGKVYDCIQDCQHPMSQSTFVVPNFMICNIFFMIYDHEQSA